MVLVFVYICYTHNGGCLLPPPPPRTHNCVLCFAYPPVVPMHEQHARAFASATCSAQTLLGCAVVGIEPARGRRHRLCTDRARALCPSIHASALACYHTVGSDYWQNWQTTVFLCFFLSKRRHSVTSARRWRVPANILYFIYILL